MRYSRFKGEGTILGEKNWTINKKKQILRYEMVRIYHFVIMEIEFVISKANCIVIEP